MKPIITIGLLLIIILIGHYTYTAQTTKMADLDAEIAFLQRLPSIIDIQERLNEIEPICERSKQMTGSEMYWITRLDGIVEGTEVILALSMTIGIIATIIFVIVCCIGEGEDDKDTMRVKKILRRVLLILWPLAIFALAGRLFIPTTKQMAAIIVVPKIVNNAEAKEIPDNLMKLCNEWIKAETKEIKSN